MVSDNEKGLVLAVASTVFVGSSFILKKKGLKRAAANGTRAGIGGYTYLLEPLWWVGLVTMTFGEIANFVAYVYAPAVLVTPLGALSIIISAVLAHFLLNEKLRKMGVWGCVCCIVGSVMIVIHAPQEHTPNSVEEIWKLAMQPAFLIYVATSMSIVLALVLYCEPLCGQTNILVYIGICSLMGSLTVMSIKAVGIAIKLTLEGINQIWYAETWFFVMVAAVCVVMQMIYLNKTVGSKPTKVNYIKGGGVLLRVLDNESHSFTQRRRSREEEEEAKEQQSIMAAAVSSVWAKPGAWALDAEEHEAELQQQALPSSKQGNNSSSDFPSLAAAATTKSKKKKAQTLSLAEFASYSSVKAAPAPQTERLTQAELVSLPTGPRERSAEELDRSKGFRSYGRDDSRWGPSRVSEDGERRGTRDRDSGPSRADETDNWAAGKKPQSVGFDRRERGGGFFESQSQSKADEVDSWVSTKPSEPRRVVGSGDRFEKRGSFESLSRNRDSQYSGGSDSDSWGRRREETGGAAPPSGGSRPRLVLQPRTLPVAAVVEVKPESPVKAAVEKPKGANPFGNARPREEVLAEKGQDWKEIEEKLEAVKLKDVAAAIEKPDARSPGKMGFGLGNAHKDDRTERSWRKSSEQSEEGAAVEEPIKDEANEEAANKEEAHEEASNKEEAENKN
ncbi:unnamed protein product [Thlaspi arvense]|uniref:Probable magnesium transporter n=1 Tax=Thlaspi arvense TaxID=13288 RepID=A0AAU9SYV1_THLAR|nr:unnamed protein product [Thlaspi arvense]